MKATSIAVLTVLMLASAGQLRAEKAPMTPEELLETSTHAVVGTITTIYQREETIGDWHYTNFLAEIHVEKCEKGEGVEADSLVYARYWRRRWVGLGLMPPSTSGHDPLPDEGDQVRAYLAKNAYDGFTRDNKDGGFNVIGCDGFEIIKPAQEDE